ncbi:hypothetical protein LOTGIDRAFT_236593 [Lottia gigantea]|uniref:Ubiquitin-like domain-containing protein n=1 Tax=Lottia gigantea TaxID=225164 RepID=V3ZLY2_LOTGI|nr:hypothetical protein LOTGIDRAFT_236593 [Lottia gigantea]ESO83430.1 hypothetical protein LOTGIDRAFT_236593 [Lottia gigantea]
MFREFKEEKLVPRSRENVQTCHDDLIKTHHDDYSSDEDLPYAEVNLNHVVGKQMVIWSYKMPDTLAIYTPLAGDDVRRLTEFVKTNLQFNNDTDKLMVLKPKRSRPVNIIDIYRIKHGSCITVMPKCDPTITLEAKQLNAKYDLVLNTNTTVRELKLFLQNQKGYPFDRIEMLYKDAPLLNDRHLFEYKIGHKSRIFVMLHLYYDMLVHIECFWGQTYHIYVDPCMTSMNIIYMILRRTVSPNLKNVQALFELYLPKHQLALYNGKSHMKWHDCLGNYGVLEGSILKLISLGIQNKLGLQNIPVTLDDGLTHVVTVSQYDCWAIVALKVHGISRIPINIIRLYKDGKEIDFSETVGFSFKRNIGPRISASALQAQIDPDTLYGIELTIDLGSGIQEVIRCSASRTIKKVKERLQDMGVPNATVYDLYSQDTKLPNSGKIVDVIDDPRIPLKLKLKRYPVYIHTPKTVIYKMFAHAHESLATFKVRIQMKTGLSVKHYQLMVAGRVITSSDDKSVFHSAIGIKMSVFLIPLEKIHTFIVLYNDWLVKIPIPYNPIYSQIKEALWGESQIPDGCMYSITNFLMWFFQKTDRRRRHFKSKRTFDPLAIGGPLETVRLPEVQQDQMKELRQEKKNKSVVKIHGRHVRNYFPFKPDVITMETAALLSQR